MAAAATAVASSFSTLKKCISSSTNIKNCCSLYDHHPVRISCPTTLLLQHGSISCSNLHQGIDYFGPIGPIGPISSATGVCSKWRGHRIAAALAQEEASSAAAVTEEEEEQQLPEAEVEESDAVENSATSAADVSTKLYFGNLPYHCDSAQLAGIIQEYASPELIEVLYDRDTGRSRGFAFVTMSSVEECNIVIDNLDAREYGGRTLRVNFSDKPKPKDPLYPETDHKLFVGNLAWSVTSEILTEAFQQYGNVVGARVLYDGETGRSRGYGFVCYETRAEMEAAIEALNGVELEGRVLRVSLAQGKK